MLTDEVMTLMRIELHIFSSSYNKYISDQEILLAERV